jgi:DNA gyrase subunit A
VNADELLALTESTESTPGERAVTAIPLDDARSLAIGTSAGIVKRWNRESPSTMDSWTIIDLKPKDAVVFAAAANDDDRLVFISSDSSLLTFDAANVRPQGRNAGGMTGMRLSDGSHVACFAVIPSGKIAWTYEEGDNGLSSQSGAVVLTVAGDSEALPGTENGSAKLTPLEMYPVKGRGTGGVRSQRFLKGQDVLLTAWVGTWPLHASTASGSAVELPQIDMRRDASGQDLAAPIAFVA